MTKDTVDFDAKSFLEASQLELCTLISHLLQGILLCQCAAASVRDDSVVGLEPELLSTSCRASRSPWDLACAPEMHDG